MPDLSVLTAAGMNLDALSDDERATLERLDDSDVRALAALRTKLSGGDV